MFVLLWCRSPKLKSPTWPDCSAKKKFGFVSFRVCVGPDTKSNRTERIFSETSQSLALGCWRLEVSLAALRKVRTFETHIFFAPSGCISHRKWIARITPVILRPNMTTFEDMKNGRNPWILKDFQHFFALCQQNWDFLVLNFNFQTLRLVGSDDGSWTYHISKWSQYQPTQCHQPVFTRDFIDSEKNSISSKTLIYVLSIGDLHHIVLGATCSCGAPKK